MDRNRELLTRLLARLEPPEPNRTGATLEPDPREPRIEDSPLVASLREALRKGVRNPVPQRPVVIFKPSDEQERMH
jgi:hypothetical protein